MTLPNKITIGRILLIPVFVGLAVYHGQAVAQGQETEAWRWAAIVVFLIASISDGVDGYIARRYNMHSQLGRILDPLADKGLLIAAIITLSVSPWAISLPLWFPLLVISRDLIIVSGCLLIHYIVGHVEVRPHWTGKIATFLQMAAVAWVLLQIARPDPIFAVTAAGAMTLISGVVYVRAGFHQLRESSHAHADLPSDKPGDRHRR